MSSKIPRTHIIGAGLAGLAAATRLSGLGHAVTLYEAVGHAGGRVRSFHDPVLDRLIDNGNHLVLSGNTSLTAYLDETGASQGLCRADAVFPFVNVRTGVRWSLRPNAGPLPWWVLAPSRRPPGTSASAFLSALKFWRADADVVVSDVLSDDHPLFETFWAPLALAVLNTPLDRAAAKPLWPVLVETFLRGAASCRPLFAPDGLSAGFIDPALTHLRRCGAVIKFRQRLRAIESNEQRVVALNFSDCSVSLGPTDSVLLAIPHNGAQSILPGIGAPSGGQAIVNAHFRLPSAPLFDAPFIGLVGAAAHWVFVRGDVASVTISAADHWVDQSITAIADAIWPDVARAIRLDGAPRPIFRIIKERRATFSQTPRNMQLRPGPTTDFKNLYLAGDWTNTGLPATIEGAVRSGHHAAIKVDQSQQPRRPD
ncbi:MAG: hydroxysqualene dehydroxylase HpnE [Alphaproteobacteria bacterium]|nr:hydroxysqualene dehydroxylase HpnE [Alphaproteobacteria bacterium]